jgi:NAD(P)-dependent dehydrogenase (short-subunit alcohol dehydrogenase family)
MSKMLVVGGAGGVGSAVLAAFVQRGDEVVTTVLDAVQAQEVQAAHGDKVTVHVVDLLDAEAAKTRLQVIAAELGGLDGVVVAAAVAPDNCPVETTPLANFRLAFEVNTLGNIAVFQATMPALRARNGRIIFISSTMGRVAMPAMGAYATSKFGLEGATDVMRREAAHLGVAVCLVVPGTIRTPMLTDKLAKMRNLYDAMDEGSKARYGHFMLRLQAIASQGNDTSSQSGEEVAETVITALSDPAPRARYLVGTAVDFYASAKAMPDEDVDALLAQMFSAEAVVA